MKHFIPCIVAIYGLLLSTASIAAFVSDTQITGTIFSDQSSRQVVFNSNEALSSRFTFNIPLESQGIDSPIYLAAKSESSWYMKNKQGSWVKWDNQISTLEAAQTQKLSETISLDVTNKTELAAGEYSVFAGYKTANGDIHYSAIPTSFIVFKEHDSQLHAINEGGTLEAYIKAALLAPNDNIFIQFSSSPVADSNISQTITQEQGVDEADVIKINGDILFAVSKNTLDSVSRPSEIQLFDPDYLAPVQVHSYKLTESPASNILLDTIQLELGQQSEKHELYSLNKRDKPLTDLLIMVSNGAFNGSSRLTSSIRVNFVDSETPSSLKKLSRIAIDGDLISSRVIDNTLYLVSRYIPKQQLLQAGSPQAEFEDIIRSSKLEELLPGIQIGNAAFTPLVNSKDCFLVPIANQANPTLNITTITAIPVDAPENHQSSCIAGATEAIYMSPRNLYLATSNNNYPIWFGIPLIAYEPDQTTLIHKFAINNAAIDYKSSTEIEGHLGWDQNKKSFRFGENNETLHVVTSVGQNWGNNSTTRLSVLQQDSAGKLKEVSHIDNLGKPGERLYASRFFGDTAYLVTFRMTDPLYALDLSDPLQPKVSGELTIDGYSDYLFPVAKGYLLGIGKDAIADTNATDTGNRGAWYQGLKLSLFDVNDASKPQQVDSVVIGKRGTTSEALFNHHALTLLPASDNQNARVILPVQLHDTIPTYTGFDPNLPNASYDLTHTAFYGFDIDLTGTPSFQFNGKALISDNTGLPTTPSFENRSVLFGDSAHFLHENTLFSVRWDNLAP